MPVNTDWIRQAKEILGESGVLLEASDLQKYTHDEFAQDIYSREPLAVVKPSTEEQVARIIQLCSRMKVPVVPRGAGTGLSAGCTPMPESVVLSMELLNRVLEVDSANHTITVQAGVTLERLYQEVEKVKLFFPPHPGDESAMVGGTVATNAGGARAVKYGTIKRFVLGLQVVLADGEIVELGGKYIKSSTGYNLLDLIIGSEGTLCIITHITLSLIPPPGSIQTLIVPFESVEAAIESVASILAADVVPLAVEFVEHSALRFSENLLNRKWPTGAGTASLMIILDGIDEESVLSMAEKIGEVLEQQGALDILIADKEERQREILEIRSMIYESLRPGTAELFDVCVPRAQIAGHVKFIHELEQKYEIPLPTYGHAADGNVHTHYMYRRLEDGVLGAEIPDWGDKYEQVRMEIYKDAIRRSGIISGEHGIGLVKRDFLETNLGTTNLRLMKAIKKVLDPQGILNPGKIFLN